jgi:hypothetical protein
MRVLPACVFALAFSSVVASACARDRMNLRGPSPGDPGPERAWGGAEAPAATMALDAPASEPGDAPVSQGGDAPAARGEAGGTRPAGGPAATPDKLVITGRVAVVTDDVAALVALVRDRVTGQGGAVARENLSGVGGVRPRAHVSLRLPPGDVPAFLRWLGEQARVEERQLDSEDVTRAYFEQELAIRNLEVTANRLQELMGTRAGSLAEVLQVERELTRVRGEIEQLKGARRFLADRIARATLDLTITTRADAPIAIDEPEAKFQLVPSVDVLSFVDRRDQHRHRVGGGVSLLFNRHFAIELKLFPRRDADARSLLVNLATALYSDFLGAGRRRFFNPYLGLAVGAGRINDRGTFTVGGDVGLELVRTRWLLLDLRGRAAWLRTDAANQLAVSGILGAGVPF